MIVVVDYGVGNLRSVLNMLKKAGADAQISGDPAEIDRADKLILPGVGHFAHAMQRLQASGLVPALERHTFERRKPLLGICVGAQMLGRRSEEGDHPGLGWIDMECRRFPTMDGYRIPHMTWNELRLTKDCVLFPQLEPDSRYYFVHSYYLACEDDDDIVATTEYGIEFTSAVQRANIFGTQFHPEKSHRYGLMLMRAFDAAWAT